MPLALVQGQLRAHAVHPTHHHLFGAWRALPVPCVLGKSSITQSGSQKGPSPQPWRHAPHPEGKQPSLSTQGSRGMQRGTGPATLPPGLLPWTLLLLPFQGGEVRGPLSLQAIEPTAASRSWSGLGVEPCSPEQMWVPPGSPEKASGIFWSSLSQHPRYQAGSLPWAAAIPGSSCPASSKLIFHAFAPRLLGSK